MAKYLDKVDKTLTKRRRSCVSELISVQEFRESWKPFITQPDCDIDEEIKKSMKITDSALLFSLNYDCNPDHMDCKVKNLVPLTTPLTVYNINGVMRPIEAINLTTVSLQEKDLKKRNESRHYKAVTRHYFTKNAFDITARKPILEMKIRDISYDDVLLEVHVFRPAKLDSDNTKCHLMRSSMRTVVCIVLEHYLVFGNQKLTELRDVIYCLSDEVRVKEISNLNESLPPKAKDVYKSGFFYINGIFYNDFRNQENKDYSRVIIDWAATNTPDFGPYETKKMEETRFLDLKLKLGYPYVYQHQGDCEHIIMFNSIRMINKEDSHNSLDYPLLLSSRRVGPSVNCMLCRTNAPKWIVIGNERLPSETCFVCSICFRSYNYTKEGEKIGQFKAFCLEDDVNDETNK